MLYDTMEYHLSVQLTKGIYHIVAIKVVERFLEYLEASHLAVKFDKG